MRIDQAIIWMLNNPNEELICECGDKTVHFDGDFFHGVGDRLPVGGWSRPDGTAVPPCEVGEPAIPEPKVDHDVRKPDVSVGPHSATVTRWSRDYGVTRVYKKGDTLEPKVAQWLIEAGCEVMYSGKDDWKLSYYWTDDELHYADGQKSSWDTLCDLAASDQNYHHFELSALPDSPGNQSSTTGGEACKEDEPDRDIEVVYLDEKDNPHLDVVPYKIGINRCSKVVTYYGTTYSTSFGKGDEVDPQLAQHLAEAGCEIDSVSSSGRRLCYRYKNGWLQLSDALGSDFASILDVAEKRVLHDHFELASIPDPPEREDDEDENVITKVVLHPHQNRVELKFSSPMMVDADGTDHAVVSFDIKDRIQLDVAQALIEAGCTVDSVGRHENRIPFWMEDGDLKCDKGRSSTHQNLSELSQEPFHHHFELSGIPDPSEEEPTSEKATIYDLERGDEVSFDVAQEVIQHNAEIEIVEPYGGKTFCQCRMKDGELQLRPLINSDWNTSECRTFSGLVRSIKDDDDGFQYFIQSPPTPPDDRQQKDQAEDQKEIPDVVFRKNIMEYRDNRPDPSAALVYRNMAVSYEGQDYYEEGDEIPEDLAKALLNSGFEIKVTYEDSDFDVFRFRDESLQCAINVGCDSFVDYNGPEISDEQRIIDDPCRPIESNTYSIESFEIHSFPPEDDQPKEDQGEEGSSSDEPQGKRLGIVMDMSFGQQDDVEVLDLCRLIERYLECCSPALRWDVEYESNEDNFHIPAIKVEGMKSGLSQTHFIDIKSLMARPIKEIDQLRRFTEKCTRRKCKMSIKAKVKDIAVSTSEDEDA